METNTRVVMIFAEAYNKQTGELTKDMLSRLKKGLEIWKRDKNQDFLVTGGVHHPFRLHREICQDMAAWLIEQSVPKEKIYIVGKSYDTWTNIRNSLNPIRAQGWETVILVSHVQHLKRIQAIFKVLALTRAWLREIKFVLAASSYLDRQDVRHEVFSWVFLWFSFVPPLKKFIWTRIFEEYKHLR